MELKRKIFFYGNSVILGTLGANLRDCPQFQVTVLLPPLPGRQRLEELKPDVILFDLESTRPEAAFSLLGSRPGLLLVGVSRDSNLVKMWTGRELEELSTRDIMDVIDVQLKGSNARTIWQQEGLSPSHPTVGKRGAMNG